MSNSEVSFSFPPIHLETRHLTFSLIKEECDKFVVRTHYVHVIYEVVIAVMYTLQMFLELYKSGF